VDHICTFGFGGSAVDGQPRHVDMFIPAKGPLTADDFANAVFEAEGATLEGCRGQLHAAFRRYMRADVVEANLIRAPRH
jgi:hypothetical protein